MSEILVRNLDRKVVERLKARAKRHGRSLQAEVKRALEQAAGAEDVSGVLDKWDRRLAGRRFSSSAGLIREDRKR